MSNCRRLRKPVFARDPVGALRYAWLRAPPSNRANLTQILRESLTRNAPYEGGQSDHVRRSSTREGGSVPTIEDDPAKQGGHGANAPLPTLIWGIASQALSEDLG